MPTVDENRAYWTVYDWKDLGQEWTGGYGGSRNGWDFMVYPRIRSYLPCDHILELAPGHGVWTHFLRDHCKRMTLVDLAPNCIEFCRKRFGRRGMTYHVNDGRSLDMVPDNSVDFVFSLHSLVHCEHDVMRDYVRQLARKLRPGGAGVIHHSNFGTFVDPATGQGRIENPHWRGRTMTAEKFRTDCRDAGLWCYHQEIVPWGDDSLIDCFSAFVREETPSGRETVVTENNKFWRTIRQLRRVDEWYRRPGLSEAEVGEIRTPGATATQPA